MVRVSFRYCLNKLYRHVRTMKPVNDAIELGLYPPPVSAAYCPHKELI